MADRMLRGQWVSIASEKPYHAYDTNMQFLKEKTYNIDQSLPLDIMHDFNIGHGKPMSAAVGQYKDESYHIFKDFIVEGFDTEQIINEMIDSGIFETVRSVRVFGDFNGLNRDTRSKMNDYDIILKALQKYTKNNGMKLQVSIHIPRSGNPPVRSRQNVVNAHCLNENKKIRLWIYKDAPTVDEGLRLTKIKKGSTYQEDDSDRFQHVVTALGYYVHECFVNINKIRKKVSIGSYR